MIVSFENTQYKHTVERLSPLESRQTGWDGAHNPKTMSKNNADSTLAY
jgi:hypothetical protein